VLVRNVAAARNRHPKPLRLLAGDGDGFPV
jgi:hypothetical protein